MGPARSAADAARLSVTQRRGELGDDMGDVDCV
jgi:hypothetical protein